jgi:hypothetical protein
VGSFAAKSSANTRELPWPPAIMATARLATDFHQNHATSPLAGFCNGQFRATALGVIWVFLRALVFGSFGRFRRFNFLRLIEYQFSS